MYERKLTVLTMLDLSKAFKTLDYNMLLNKMSSLFILSLAAVQWFQSYFTARRWCVKVDDHGVVCRVVSHKNKFWDHYCFPFSYTMYWEVC
ncbi:hypothetical protein PR048_009127 [Dryococelus australis]|uniref:Reverse transcriptase domain-containing protein n=1 Tax=Dryococelus australis TaxID=614101 RepID=A0ABQ9HZF0_9NEOP|nr:hypothetical protein PR048_009127 [Dryococelus australis]